MWRKHVSAFVAVLTLLWVSGICEGTSITFPGLQSDNSFFGTTVVFSNGTGSTFTYLGLNQLPPLVEGVSQTHTVSIDGANQGIAVATPTAFSLGAESIAQSKGNIINTIAAAGTGMSVTGPASAILNGSVTVEGNFSNFAANGVLMSVFVYDFLDQFLAEIDVNTGLVNGNVVLFEDATSCNPLLVPTPQNDFGCPFQLPPVIQGQPAPVELWGGQLTVPLFIPNVPNNGLIVELDTEASNLAGNAQVVTDFLGTVGLNITPGAGQVVSLADGQTFQSTSSIPEPSSLLLLGTGLLGIISLGHRKLLH